MKQTVKFSMKNVKARDISTFNKKLHTDPHENFDTFAELLARTVLDAPEDVKAHGPLDDPETYLSLPMWLEEGDEGILFMELVEGLGDALGKLLESTKNESR